LSEPIVCTDGNGAPVCPHCGAKMVEYRHVLNAPLADALTRLRDHGGPVNIKNLDLTREQWTNFQKLRYWGLVRKTCDAKGKRVGGTWEITRKGLDFIKGCTAVPRTMWTYRGEPVRGDDGEVFIHHLVEGYALREDYADTAQAKEKTGG